MPSQVAIVDFPVPAPSWLVGAATAFVYLIVLIGLDPLLPFALLTPWTAPLLAAGGVLVYAGLLYAIDLRDPRIWRDRARFADYALAWSGATGRPRPDDVEMKVMRARTWRDASVAMAQQGGAVAGAGTAATLIETSWPLAVIAFGVSMCLVGLLLKEWLIAPDRAELGPELERE